MGLPIRDISYNELIEVQPDNLSILEDGAFWQNNLSNIKIPDNVAVGNYAFKYSQLETIEVPISVSYIRIVLLRRINKRDKY